MERPKKRVYDEGYDAASKSTTLQALFNRANRATDRLFSPEYKNFRESKRGITDITKLSDKELKFLNRDLKIKGFESPSVKNEINLRKDATKVAHKDASITPLYKSDNGKDKLMIGFDHKTKKHVISTRDFNNDPRLPVWRPLSEKNLPNELRQFGADNKKNFTTLDNNVKGRSVEVPVKEQSLRQFIDSVFKVEEPKKESKKEADLTARPKVDKITELNFKTLSNPESLVGKNVQTKDVNNELATFKVLSADKNNIILEKKGIGDDKGMRMLNVNKEKQKYMLLNTTPTGILDSKTIMGYNKQDKQEYIGKIQSDNSVKWENKESYLTKMAPDQRGKLDKKLESGNYVIPEIAIIGKTKQNNPIYSGTLKNGESVVSVNLNKFSKADSSKGKQLTQEAKGLNASKGQGKDKGEGKGQGKNQSLASKAVENPLVTMGKTVKTAVTM